jgi:hypothetical protein
LTTSAHLYIELDFFSEFQLVMRRQDVEFDGGV